MLALRKKELLNSRVKFLALFEILALFLISVGKRGLGPGGDFNWERGMTPKPNWEYASRLLDLKSARVNLGLRDLVGFLCKKRIEFWFLKETECLNSLRRWKGIDRNRIMCVKQPHVTDPCDVYV